MRANDVAPSSQRERKMRTMRAAKSASRSISARSAGSSILRRSATYLMKRSLMPWSMPRITSRMAGDMALLMKGSAALLYSLNCRNCGATPTRSNTPR